MGLMRTGVMCAVAAIILSSLAQCVAVQEKFKSGTFEKFITGRNVKVYEFVRITNKSQNESCEKILIFSFIRINFVFCLRHDPTVFAEDVIISIKDEISEHKERLKLQNRKQIYKGIVNNDKESFVYGKIDDNNKFDGYFILNQTYYFIEPFSNYNTTDLSELCIIYLINERSSVLHFDTSDANLTSKKNYSNRKMHNRKSNLKFSTPIRLDNNKFKTKKRSKRSVRAKSCTVHLVADHTFYEHVGKQSVGATVSELVYRLGDADVTFRGTDFNGDGYGDNIGFLISQITIFTSKYSTDYKLGDESLDVYDYLDTFSQYNFDDFCLAVAFTHRDFERGILGLAWVASSSFYGAAGGICQKRIRYSEDNKLYSLNTALVTTLNYGERILGYDCSLVLTHELGHNFGSSHDPIGHPICSPDDDDGNYLMYAYASEGSKPNHNKFSTCSINSMHPVIINKGWCFSSYNGPHCGNFVVEDGEECDCGDTDTCAFIDPCCSPQGSVSGSDPPCTLRRALGYECSSKNSPCCTDECKFIPSTLLHVCSTSSECTIDAICNGTAANCPTKENKVDDTLCDNGRRLCQSGVCFKSICNKYDLEQCECSERTENECLICCRHSNSSQCFPTSNFAIYDENMNILHIKPGERCNSVAGYCDNNGKCVSKSDTSAMERIFSEETGDEIKKWFGKYWYYVLTGITLLAFLALVFVATKKKTENVQLDAFRLGRLENFVDSAEVEISQQVDNLKEKEDNFEKMIESIQRGDESRDYVRAIGRLTTFFPTAPVHIVTEIARKSTSESVAVRLLILKGYPVRKVVVNELSTTITA
ncbi:disintegrin and metalloproteinase domain-containing protein 10-like [Mytilus edulis]|uniref:disintegrin and metalloproteinase domain-containing protein 10-like n=1 Tax=Mytilus edulis TaxID=6550 RepID=UPI0039F006D1